MKIRLEYDKKNFIWLGGAVVIAIALYLLTGCNIWSVLLFCGAFYVLKSMKLELSEKLPWIWTAILFAGGSVLTTFSIQYLLLDAELFAKTTTAKWNLNVVCVLVFYLLMLLVTNRAGIGCAISHTLLVLFGFVDYFVYLFRQNEFSFADLRAIGTGLSVAEGYRFELTERCAYVILISILFVTFVLKCKVRFKERLHMSILAVLLTAIGCMVVAIQADGVNTETWEMKGTYKNGYILNFILGIRDSIISEPEGYSKDAVAELEQQYQGDGSDYSDGVDVEDPTIIVIMNESFADLSVIGDLRTNLPLTPFMDSLTENTIRGYALSSVFGAKTPNSEWEFQTGNSMAFLPSGSVVYQQYLSSDPTSLVSTLKNIGYTCVAMHPYYATGWSRNTVYPKLGFEESYFIDDFDQTNILRKYITDQELYDGIIERYENRGEGEKLYVLGVTMQNHGGYTETYDNFDELYYKTGTSYTDVNQYLSLVHESDVALESLITYFENVEEPVEIVFFGDHQPSLNSKFYKLLNGKGLSGLTEAELENLYKVPFFIWTNYESEAEEVEITSLNFLSTMALQRAGIDLPAYNQFLADMMEVVPAINSRGYYSLKNGTYLHVYDASGEEAEWIEKYNILQYNSMFDTKNRSSLFFPYIESP